MSIAFSWQGLPQYAARQLRPAIAQLGQPCTVIGTRPAVPIQGMEEALGQPIHWVDGAQVVCWADLGLAVPQVFFQAGWSCPAFNALGDEVRAAGGKVCLLMDNDWRGNLRQWFGGAWFRLVQKRKFAAVLVPGRSGHCLARWYGFAQEEIFEGLYGADPAVFFDGPPLAERPKRILFVGQYIARKDCVGLAQAFASVADQLPEWELHLYGSGPLQDKLPRMLVFACTASFSRRNSGHSIVRRASLPCPATVKPGGSLCTKRSSPAASYCFPLPSAPATILRPRRMPRSFPPAIARR